MIAALLTNDLLFLSRVTSQAHALGIPIKVVQNGESLIELASKHPLRLAMLDLGKKDWDIGHVVSSLKVQSSPPYLIAYGPHVDEAALTAAHEAGCDEVMTKGQFDRAIVDILRRFVSTAETTS